MLISNSGSAHISHHNSIIIVIILVGKGGQNKKHDTTTGNHMTSFSYVLVSNSDIQYVISDSDQTSVIELATIL